MAGMRIPYGVGPVLLLLLTGLSGCGIEGNSVAETEETAEEAVVTVRAEPSRLGTEAEIVEGLGRCEAIPDHIATLTPAVEGHVHELLVKQGSPVEKGQPIIELDKSVAQADLAEKTASRDSLKAALALLKSLPRPEERKANELAVDQARVAVERASAILDHLRPLAARHEVSEQQIYDAEKALETAQIQEKSARATLDAMMIGPRQEAVAQAEAQVETAEGLVEFSQAHLEFHTLRSPIDGVLDSLTCHPGQTIAIGQPVGQIVDTRQVFAVVWLPAHWTQSVKAGQPASIASAGPETSSSEADSSDSLGHELAGSVDSVGRIADPQTGGLPIRVLVDNPEGLLTVGQPVRVSIVVDERKNVLQVPVSAIYDLGEGPVLNVVRDGKVVALHPELGRERDGWVAVSGTDLKPGEPVIVEGGYNLPEETPVTLAREPQSVASAEAAR
jgi:RND family efflux transporter MFP subunit